MPTALILTNGPMGIRNHHQVDKLRALLMAGAILAGCVREPYQIGRKDPSPCSASAEHRLYVDMVWIVENARSRSLCVRYSTPDTPGGGRAGIAVELDRYKFPEGNSLQHKTWVAATQPQAYDLGTVKSVYKTGELCGAGITDGPLAIVKNWRTSGPVVGLCKSDCFTPIRQFGPWDSPVFLDGHTAIIEIPVRHPSTAPTQGFQYKYVRIDSSGRQSAISVPDGTQHLHSNGQVHLAIGEWGTIALNDSGQELCTTLL